MSNETNDAWTRVLAAAAEHAENPSTEAELLVGALEHELILQAEVYPTDPPRWIEDWESYVEYVGATEEEKRHWVLSDETKKRWGLS